MKVREVILWPKVVPQLNEHFLGDMFNLWFKIVVHLELHGQLLFEKATFSIPRGLAIIPVPQHVIDLYICHQSGVLTVYNLHSF